MGDGGNEIIDKIVADLEELKNKYKNIRKNTTCYKSETDNCDSCIADHKLETRLATIDTVLDIVRQYY